MSARDKVIAFHQAMGQPILTYPQVPPGERAKLRARLVLEECFEFVEALLHSNDDAETDLIEAKAACFSYIDKADVVVNLPEAADALADITYVVEGSYLEFGIDGDAVLEEVHRANMMKASGPVRADGKRLKPEGWTPPDIEGVLVKQKNERLEALMAESFPLEEVRVGTEDVHLQWGRGWGRALTDEERRLVHEHIGARPFAPKWPEE